MKFHRLICVFFPSLSLSPPPHPLSIHPTSVSFILSFLILLPRRRPPCSRLTSDPQTHPNASKLPLKDAFTFDDYRLVGTSYLRVTGSSELVLV